MAWSGTIRFVAWARKAGGAVNEWLGLTVTDEADPRLRVQSQHAQPLTDGQLRAAPVAVTTTNPTANPETGLAKEIKQLPDGHSVVVLNPTANPETGLAKEDTLLMVRDNLGVQADAAATTDTGAFSLIALFKRLLSRLTGGNFLIGLYDSQSVQSAEIDNLRRLSVAIPARLFGDSFGDGIGSGEDVGVFGNPVLTGSGGFTAAAGSGQLSLNLSGANGTVMLQSNRVSEFKSGTVSGTQVGVQFPLVFGVGGASFAVVSRKAGVDTVVASGSFNGTAPAVLTDAAATFHQYQLRYLGNSCLFISDGVVLHRMSGQVTTPRTGTLKLPLTAQWIDTGGGSAVLRIGSFNSADGYFFQATYNSGVLTAAIRGFTALRFGISDVKFGSVVSPGNRTVTPLPAATTITAPSNGAALPQATINVSSTTGWATAGKALIVTSAGSVFVDYTGITANTLTGCTGGTGTLATGNNVAPCYVGLADTVLDYGGTTLNCNGSASVAASFTVYFQYSHDALNWDISVPIPSTPDINLGMIPVPLRSVLPFFRAIVANTAPVAQTSLRFTAMHHYEYPGPLTRYLNQPITNGEPVIAVSAAMAAEFVNAVGTFDTLMMTARKTLLAEEPNFTSVRTDQIPVGISQIQLDSAIQLANRTMVEVLFPRSTANVSGSTVNGVAWVGWSNALTGSSGSRELQPGESWRFPAATSVGVFGITNFAGQRMTITQFAP